MTKLLPLAQNAVNRSLGGTSLSQYEIPVLSGQPWHIGDNPDLGEHNSDSQEIVDHAIFPSDDGRWHLWACIRGTALGRVLYHWEGAGPLVPNWERRGIAMRAEPRYGESIDDWNGEEWIQAPHVIVRDGVHHMFYGGHRSENGVCQVCLATSPDGRDFGRHQDACGFSRVFVGPGEARDPMVVEIDGLYHCYYAGHDPEQRAPGKVYCRTSRDLIRWSDWVTVNWGGVAGDGPWSAECPFVVQRGRWFYLFRTCRYAPPAETHVYCSDDPLDFGLGDDSKHLTTLQVAAPEIVRYGDDWLISSVEDLQGGVQMWRLDWKRA